MAAEEEVVILARLAGTRQFLVNAGELGVAIEELGLKTEATGAAMVRTGRRGFFMNQALFTVRRLMYGVSLATVAAGAMAVKWGFDFNSAMQQAKVALRPVQDGTFNVNRELEQLFNFTKYTPFQFRDMTIAFRQMYFGFRVLGISAGMTNETLKAMVDNLSATGRTSPGALNRVSVALQHMANLGHLTGQAVQQLARDGIQIMPALRKELHLTADQMHNIGALGIPAQVALRAIIDYTESTPGLMNAAHRQALRTLHGQFTTFKDNLSQLMGAIEKGFFGRIQQRLTDMNAWFNRFSRVVRHGNMDAVVRAIAGAGGVMLWHQIAADVTLVTHAFEGVIGMLVHSRPLWATVYAGLLLMHGILIPLNFLLHHFGVFLYVLIPLFIAYRTQLMLIAMAERTAAFWTAVFTKETKALTFAQWLARAATKALVYSYVLMKLAEERVIATQIALTTWDYRLTAATLISAAAIKFRTIWDWLYVAGMWAATLATGALTGAVDLLTAAFLANPIGLIIEGVILLITGLVLLYMRWGFFHRLVDGTFHWIVDHWRLLAVILLGPFGFFLVGVIDHFKAIKRIIGGVFGWIWNKMQWLSSGLHRLWKHIPGHGLIGSVLGGHIPGLAMGGTVVRPGLSLIGERGPELLTLPVGATVAPIPTLPTFATYSPQGERQPIIVQVVLNKKVLAEAYAEAHLDAVARL